MLSRRRSHVGSAVCDTRPSINSHCGRTVLTGKPSICKQFADDLDFTGRAEFCYINFTQMAIDGRTVPRLCLGRIRSSQQLCGPTSHAPVPPAPGVGRAIGCTAHSPQTKAFTFHKGRQQFDIVPLNECILLLLLMFSSQMKYGSQP